MGGLVDHPIELSLEELRALGKEEYISLHHCTSNPFHRFVAELIFNMQAKESIEFVETERTLGKGEGAKTRTVNTLISCRTFEGSFEDTLAAMI
ncbi:MAG: hypothetical protein ACREIC_12855 [Limisphaerales bacterium]